MPRKPSPNYLIRQGDAKGLREWLRTHPAHTPEAQSSLFRQGALQRAVQEGQPDCVAVLLEGSVKDLEARACRVAIALRDEGSLGKMWPTVGSLSAYYLMIVAAIDAGISMRTLEPMLTRLAAIDKERTQVKLWFATALSQRLDVMEWLAPRQDASMVFNEFVRDEHWDCADLVHRAALGGIPVVCEDFALRRAPPGSLPSVLSAQQRRSLQVALAQPSQEEPSSPPSRPRL